MLRRRPHFDAIGDRLRLLLLLDACGAADLLPVPIRRLHALAYLSNILGPVWSEDAYDGKILKRQGGPFYPELQRELDALVGLGLVTVHNVTFVKSENKWRFDGSFSLRETNTAQIVEIARSFSAERNTMIFFRRLIFSFVTLETPIEELVTSDVTWADQRTGAGDVIDFAEWQSANYSAFAAEYFDRVSPDSLRTSRGDKLQLYMHLLKNRFDLGRGTL